MYNGKNRTDAVGKVVTWVRYECWRWASLCKVP
jgi:hypothetical protein